jgi:hypothetical protein
MPLRKVTCEKEHERQGRRKEESEEKEKVRNEEARAAAKTFKGLLLLHLFFS